MKSEAQNSDMGQNSEDVLYFAYGSNLDLTRKEQRTGPIREARRARLIGYRFAFNKKGSGKEIYANVVADPSSEVWGVLYRCTLETMQKLDVYEGVSHGHYNRADVEVIMEDGKTVGAITYVAGKGFECQEGQPSKGYLCHIIDGAKHHQLPANWIEKIEKLAGVEPSY